MDTDEITLATRANMRLAHQRYSEWHIFLISPTTGDEYSANSNDYWFQDDDDSPVLDENGEPMHLVAKVCEFYDALTGRKL